MIKPLVLVCRRDFPPKKPSLISSEKTGYVKGKHILDGIIINHKLIHSLKTSVTPGMLLKLDLSKEFNKLNWHYIHLTL